MSQAGLTGFWAGIRSLVSTSTIVIDRPRGTPVGTLPIAYPLDYGYLKGTSSGDGQGIDVWVGSLTRKRVTGIVCTVDRGKRDAEIKILVGCSRSERRRILAFHNHDRQSAVLIEAPGRRTTSEVVDPALSAGRGVRT